MDCEGVLFVDALFPDELVRHKCKSVHQMVGLMVRFVTLFLVDFAVAMLLGFIKSLELSNRIS